ncbi:MAG: hypothetical protein CVU16_02110 [Betaproteobacteria bacterium HGW-Betaproteobacteria-10]|nr:MAG: hypothetical protein CVU16_02110 [Betaproteobacteria bacterium HGW-Betaproteobacteria-10]
MPAHFSPLVEAFQQEDEKLGTLTTEKFLMDALIYSESFGLSRSKPFKIRGLLSDKPVLSQIKGPKANGIKQCRPKTYGPALSICRLAVTFGIIFIAYIRRHAGS